MKYINATILNCCKGARNPLPHLSKEEIKELFAPPSMKDHPAINLAILIGCYEMGQALSQGIVGDLLGASLAVSYIGYNVNYHLGNKVHDNQLELAGNIHHE